MSKREFLRITVTGLFAVLFISFAWILFSGINFSGQHTNNKASFEHKLFKGLTEGQVVLRRYQGQAVWVLSLSSLQRSQAKKLGDYVTNDNATHASEKPCVESADFCVLLASTKRTGINIQYTQKEPEQLVVGTLWYGGFVNPIDGALYDFLGRPYKGQKDLQTMTSVDVR